MNKKHLSALFALLTIFVLVASSIAFASPLPLGVSATIKPIITLFPTAPPPSNTPEPAPSLSPPNFPFPRIPLPLTLPLTPPTSANDINFFATQLSTNDNVVAGKPAVFRVLVANGATQGIEQVSWRAFGSDGKEVRGLIPYLSAKESQMIDFDYTFDSTVSGQARLSFEIDPYNAIDETNEQDNRVDITVLVSPAPQNSPEPPTRNSQEEQVFTHDPFNQPVTMPPLIPPTVEVRVDGIFVDPAGADQKIVSGKPARVRAVIENTGNVPLEMVEWGFSFVPVPAMPGSANVPPSDYAVSGREQNLQPGEIRVIRFEYIFVAPQGADFTVEFTLDPWKKIEENDEQNNLRRTLIHVDALPGAVSPPGNTAPTTPSTPITPPTTTTTTPTSGSGTSTTVTPAPASSTPSSSTTSADSSSSSSSKKKKSKSTKTDDKKSAKDVFYDKETLKQQFLKETMSKFSKSEASTIDNDKVSHFPFAKKDAVKKDTIEIIYAGMPDSIEFTEHVCKFKLFGWCLWGKDVNVKVPVPKTTASKTFFI